MTIKIPRKVWTLQELCQRWKVPALDVHRAIMDGALQPCVMLDVPLRPVAIINGVATVLPEVEPEPVRRYLYPVFVKQIEPFNYRCEYVCDLAKPVEGCQLWRLPAPVTLADLMGFAVVIADDLTEAEAALNPVRDEETLSTKEKSSLSVIVAAMSFRLYGWAPGDDKSTGVTDLLQEVEALGMKLSYNTVKKHLTECWARANPQLE